MAAKSTTLGCAVDIKYKNGTDKNGKDVMAQLRIKNVKTKATDQQIFDTVKAIGTLLPNGINELERIVTYGITNAGA